MERVAIIGPGGAGKSTLARQLAELTGLPVIHLDREYWRPGWVATPEDEWIERVTGLAAGARWIIDGNYGGTMETRLARADTVICLDFDRLTCIRRVLKRRFQYRDRGRSRPDMAEGCEEAIDRKFLWWLWTYPAKRRAETLGLLAAAHREGKRVVILRDAKQVRAFTAALRAGTLPANGGGARRVVVIGPSGSGKTTFARVVATANGLPLVHIDEVILNPSITGGWPGWLAALERKSEDERWLMEGAYWIVLGTTLPRADTVVELGLPPWKTMPRVLARERAARGKPGWPLSAAFAVHIGRMIRYAAVGWWLVRIRTTAAAHRSTVFLLRTDAEVVAVRDALAGVARDEA